MVSSQRDLLKSYTRLHLISAQNLLLTPYFSQNKSKNVYNDVTRCRSSPKTLHELKKGAQIGKMIYKIFVVLIIFLIMYPKDMIMNQSWIWILFLTALFLTITIDDVDGVHITCPFVNALYKLTNLVLTNLHKICIIIATIL